MKASGTAIRPQQSLTPNPAADNKPVNYNDMYGNSVTLTIDIVKRYLIRNRNVSDEEAYIFIKQCEFQGFNPWAPGEVYGIKYGDDPLQIVPGKETFTKRAQAHSQYRGEESGIVVINKNGEMEHRVGEIYLDGENIVGGWAEVCIDGYVKPKRIERGFRECCKYGKDGKPASKWASSPALMIRKCALVAALREAFPDKLGGMYIAEEMGFEENEQNAAPIVPNPRSDAMDADYTPVDEDEEDVQGNFFEED